MESLPFVGGLVPTKGKKSGKIIAFGLTALGISVGYSHLVLLSLSILFFFPVCPFAWVWVDLGILDFRGLGFHMPYHNQILTSAVFRWFSPSSFSLSIGYNLGCQSGYGLAFSDKATLILGFLSRVCSQILSLFQGFDFVLVTQLLEEKDVLPSWSLSPFWALLRWTLQN